MLFIVIEHFKDGAQAVYDRYNEKGRMLPDGLTFVDSWVTADHTHCYQIMMCDDGSLLDSWILRWTDLADFDVVPVVKGSDAAKIYEKGYAP